MIFNARNYLNAKYESNTSAYFPRRAGFLELPAPPREGGRDPDFLAKKAAYSSSALRVFPEEEPNIVDLPVC